MNTASKISVLLVEDHPIMRLGITAIISAQPDMCVCFQAATGEEAVQAFRQHRPDLVLMDLRLPGISGVEALRRMRAEDPEAKCVVLTTYGGDEDIHQALAAGAAAYVIKAMPYEMLVDALRRVHAGTHRYLPPAVAESLSHRTPNSDLSSRERQVLSLMVDGRTNKEIAAELGITEATVKCHVSVVLQRLNVADRTQAVVVALKRGLAHL